jgi:ERF superfamily
MTDKETTGPLVYTAISSVQGALSKLGIAKHKAANGGVNYAFRGIDAVYGALSPLLAEHGLIIIPRVLNRDVVERQSKNGGALFYVALQVEFDFVSAIDGSKHTACTYGEAMDSSDKATNKAMSAAYKYAAFMTFAIPTEGDNDADATAHEVTPAKPTMAGTEKCSAADVTRITDLAKAAGVELNVIAESYLKKDIAELDANQAGAAIKRLKKTIDEKGQK